MRNSYLVLLGLIITYLPSELGAATVRIRAYRATGEVDIKPYHFNTKVAITQGTRLLLTCDVTGLSENSEVDRYRWFHSLTGDTNDRYQIQDRDPYYRVTKDTLLIDVTSLGQGGKYTCFVSFSNAPQSGDSTAIITVADNAAPFLYTPTSLLLEHSVLTDVQQATGRNGQQWITCRIGGQGTRPEIWMGSELVVNSSTANSATIVLGTQHPNGLYHCLTAQSQKEYFTIYLSSTVTLPTPTVSGWNNSMWTLTSPDGSRVERYIVEFECRVRNITFVEKYMSVNASGGTGQVATNVSCFGGLGQLYRVKVWAVSGPSMSKELVCTPDGQCREKGGSQTPTTQLITLSSTSSTLPDNTGTDGGGNTPPPPPTTTITAATAATTTTTTNTSIPTSDKPSSSPSANAPSSGPQHDWTFIGVGVGVGMFLLLLVVSLVVVLIVVVVVVRRRAAHKQKSDPKMGGNLDPNSIMMQEKETGADTQYKDASIYENVVEKSSGELEDRVNDNHYSYVLADMYDTIQNMSTPSVEELSDSVTDGVHVYANAVADTDHYAVPRSMVNMTETGNGGNRSSDVEKEGYYYNVVALRNEALANQ